MLKITETNVTIMVNSMDKAIQFYQDIGLSLKNRWGDHYAMVETTGLTIGLHPSTTQMSEGIPLGEASGKISIGFMVDDIKEAKALLDTHKITYKEEDDGKSGKYLHFTDLDGTVLYFTQPSWR